MFYTYVPKKDLDVLAKFPYKVGIVTFMAFPDLLQSENKAEKLKPVIDDPFFDLLEIPSINDQEWQSIQDYVHSTRGSMNFALGLQPKVLGGVNPSSTNEEERKKAEEILVNEVEKAGERGIIGVEVCSGPYTEEKEKAKEAFVKTISTMATKASKYGISIFVETFDASWDKRRLLGPIDFSAKVIEEIRETHNNVYLLWDLGHAPMLNETPEVLRQYGDLIGHIHIGCTKEAGGKLYDRHPGFYRPGAINTEKDVMELLTVLHDIKYKGAIGFEIKPEEGQHPLEVIHTTKSVLMRAFQMYLDSLFDF